MRRYEFFFSYARADTDDTLQRFFSDLAGEVAKRAGLGMVAPEDVGFLDTHSLKTGVEWEREIADALQTCNVFVPLYSPNYFNSRFCENEWQRFYDRQNLYMAGHPQEPRPGTLIPVPWIPTKWKPQPYPPRVMTIVYAQPNAPPAYVESGLRQMSRLPSTYGDAYTALVADLAGQIVQAANDFSMPPLPARPTFDDGLNTFSFHSPPGAPVRITEPPLGPRKAMFVIVAARPQDLAGMRKQLDAYGDVGERDWRPFKPPREDSAAYLAVEVAKEAGFLFPEVIPVGQDLIDRLSHARDSNLVVVLIVDRWSLHVAEIRARMLEYDGRSFPNVVVVIPWNAHDQESVACQIELNETLRKAFPTRLQLPDPRIFRDDIASVDDLRDVIAAALKQTVERLRIDAPTKRSIPPGPTQQPVVQGPVA